MKTIGMLGGMSWESTTKTKTKTKTWTPITFLRSSHPIPACPIINTYESNRAAITNTLKNNDFTGVF